jgi:hypothetical protein
VQHESQQALDLGFARHQLQKHPRKPDRFIGQIAAALVGTDHVVPANSKRSIDRLKHRLEPLRQIPFLRNFELDATTADFCLRAQQALPHRFRCDRRRQARRAHSPERNAQSNEGKDSGIATGFGEGPPNKCTGVTIVSDSRENSAYVAEDFITGLIDWTRATLRLREPAS